jgi:hypothetical protein
MLKHFLIFLLMATSSIGHALDENRLWLPVRYQTLYLSLLKAASIAEELERCVDVVEGTLDLEQSETNHPIYRIQCRQENGWTYNEMVDGLSFATLTTVKVIEPELTAEEKEVLRVQEEIRRQEEIARQKQVAWQECRSQLLDRTRLMMNLIWQTEIEGLVEPEAYSEEEQRFSVDFDARSMWEEPLHYTADCTVRNGVAEVVLHKR